MQAKPMTDKVHSALRLARELAAIRKPRDRHRRHRMSRMPGHGPRRCFMGSNAEPDLVLRRSRHQ